MSPSSAPSARSGHQTTKCFLFPLSKFPCRQNGREWGRKKATRCSLYLLPTGLHKLAGLPSASSLSYKGSSIPSEARHLAINFYPPTTEQRRRTRTGWSRNCCLLLTQIIFVLRARGQNCLQHDSTIPSHVKYTPISVQITRNAGPKTDEEAFGVLSWIVVLVLFSSCLSLPSWPFFLFSSLLCSRAGSKDALVQFGEKI